VSAILFACLFVATAGAFFATQRLKRSTPIVERVFFYQWVSPNGDGRKDTVALRFDLPKSQRVTVTIVDARGEVVRTLAEDRFLRGQGRFVWNGRDDAGTVVPDGIYRLRIGLREEGRSVTAPRELHVDTRPPRPRIVAVTPPTILPGTSGARSRARVRFKGPANPPPILKVWRTDGGKVRQVDEFRGRRGRTTAEWNGVANGAQAPEGIYAISVTVEDKAGNRGSAPTPLPPRRRDAVRRSGVSVQYLTLTGPLEPIKPGGVARFEVGPVPRPVRWRLALMGRGGALRAGIGHGHGFALRVPSRAEPGIYSVQIQAAGRRATWPLVIGGRGNAAGLVVLPALTWQGQNQVDSNRDGFADTLDTGDSVPLARPFAHGRPPASIRAQSIPLLRFLDRIRANYDVTTDVDLVRGGGLAADAFGGYRSIVFAGSERWLTQEVNAALRRFVQGGGRVASFGVDAFRRRVEYANNVATNPSRPEALNVFGERTSVFPSPAAPMVVSTDRLNLFADTDGFVGSFTSFERSDELISGARLRSAAGRPDDGKPDLVAYTLGKGLVVRVGSEQWGAALTSSSEVSAVTRRMWTLLSR
jgi:flagellar hook assembly protein FlgD